MKILLDTNVLYSAFAKNSSGMTSMVWWISLEHEAFITPYIADELLKNTWRKEPQTLPAVIAFLESSIARMLDDEIVVVDGSPQISDPDDQTILDAAIFYDVDIIISGDKHFRKLMIQRPRIMTATQFRKEFMSKNE
ncbi:MAG: PIN domain-containing protein [Thermomicrobiales bacterium]|nr:PIN domain-containing protein [Thermomicrobiales bacterium]